MHVKRWTHQVNVQGLLSLELEAAALNGAEELLLLHVGQHVRLQVVTLVEPGFVKKVIKAGTSII